MFKALKYLLLATLYKKAKKSFMMLAVYVVVLILFNLILSDILSVVAGVPLYLLLLGKWIVIFTLLGLIGFSILKILNIARNPFEEKRESETIKKDRILGKEKLFTRSDLIIQKYMKD